MRAAVRTSSLKALGVTDADQLLNIGVRLYNCQMVGMLLGELVWGIPFFHLWNDLGALELYRTRLVRWLDGAG